MVTRNFLNMLTMALSAYGAVSCLPARTVNGETRYLCGIDNYSFPGRNPTNTVVLNAASAGISIGSGTTPPTENDYNLERTITANATASVTRTLYGTDSDGCPYTQFDITITNNNTNQTLTVTEIGYKQVFGKNYKYPALSINGVSSDVFLIDRSLLDTPLIVPPGDAGIITYRLRTVPRYPMSIDGVKLVSFTYGSDEDVVALIDAARAGTIDLQRDAGWRVGDLRRIRLESFTGGSITNSAQYVYLVITSFDEYNGAGNVVQIDFFNQANTRFRMRASATNTGGYAASELYTTTLPAMEAALPAWLRSRLISFSVPTGAGNGSSEIVQVPDNKLALRSEVEVFGTTTYSAPGEGTRLAIYRPTFYLTKEIYSGGSYASWWLRSPKAGSSTQFCAASTSGARADNASETWALAPFLLL